MQPNVADYARGRVFVDCFSTERMRSETQPLLIFAIISSILLQFVYGTIFSIEMIIQDHHILRNSIVLAVVYTIAATVLLFSLYALDILYVIKFDHPMYDKGATMNTRNVWYVRLSCLWFFLVITTLLWIDYSANFDANNFVSQYWYERSASFHKIVAFMVASLTVFHISTLVISMQGYYPSNKSVLERNIVVDGLLNDWKPIRFT